MRLAQADLPKLEALISSHDLIISLLPWTQHLPIAKLAIKHKKHFATTSYIADEMQVGISCGLGSPPQRGCGWEN